MTPTLALRGVTLTYRAGRADEVNALSGVDLEIHRGELVTVVGSNGAGKSSLVKIVAGAEQPSTGSVHIQGKDVTRRTDWQRAGLVARVFDDPRVGTAPELTIEDNLALAFSRGRRRTLRPASTSRRRAVMRERLATLGLGLEDRLHQSIGALSAGQRQSVTMIMAALSRPQVLLLDEHLAALDPSTARRVLDLTVGLAAELECATIMITHNMDHAIQLGDRLLVMGGGRLLADVRGHEKSRLQPEQVVDLIVGAGGVLSDRTALARAEGAA